ncbi:HEAT repeat domain-containing protein, partial [Candidatus Peregrinibacteria bacterium]|nr:HEAT repeat domain-containing protein [Candidatus Peregrinibacteria bacterium]
LEHGENLEERMNAVDILGQRGHWHILDVLRKILHDAGEKPELRLRVLHTLGELTLTEAMEDLIICFHSKNAEIRAAALDALARYRIFSSKKEIFVKWNLFHELEDLYERETDEENISRIIFILSKISNLEVVEFLLGVLKKADVKHKHDAIMALGKFEDDGVVKFIAPFLQSKNPEEQMSAAIALAAFNKTKLEARELIAGFLNSRDSEKLAWGIYAAGELKIKDKKYLCHKYLTSKDKDLRMQAAAALVKFGDQVALQAVLDILVNAPATVSGKLKSLLRNLDGRTLWHIEKMYQEALFHKNNS